MSRLSFLPRLLILLLIVLSMGCGGANLSASDNADDGGSSITDAGPTADASANSSAKTLTSFAFLAGKNAPLHADVAAKISGTNISVTVPFGTNVHALVATFTTTGVSANVSGAAQTSGVTPNDFSNLVTYRITAADGSSRDYEIKVSIADSSAKAITSFTVHGVGATISGNTIGATLPYGTDLTALVASFATTGTAVTVAGATQISGVTVHDFTDPTIYRVTAADGSTQDYTVKIADAPSNAKDITSFSFLASQNAGLAADAVGAIEGSTITVIVPLETDLTILVPSFGTTGSSISGPGGPQTNGVTYDDFTNDVTLAVTAADGSSQNYVVRVGAGFTPYVQDLGTSSDAFSTAVADFDDDGKPDIAYTDATGLTILRNEMAAGAAKPAFDVSFTKSLTSTTVFSVEAADVNRDGLEDLIVHNDTQKSIAILLNTTSIPGTPTFASATNLDVTTSYLTSFDVVDLNADGAPDIVFSNSSGGLGVLRNTTPTNATSATFAPEQDLTFGSHTYFVFADLDGDGKVDVATPDPTAADPALIHVYANTTTNPVAPTFTQTSDILFQDCAGEVGLFFADFNSDGLTDMAASCGKSGEDGGDFFLNTTVVGGQATFVQSFDYSFFFAPQLAADIDQDGDLDLLTISNFTGRISIALNSTTTTSDVATFSRAQNTIPTGFGQSLDAVDLNADGRPDFAVSGEEGIVVLIRQ